MCKTKKVKRCAICKDRITNGEVWMAQNALEIFEEDNTLKKILGHGIPLCTDCIVQEWKATGKMPANAMRAYKKAKPELDILREVIIEIFEGFYNFDFPLDERTKKFYEKLRQEGKNKWKEQREEQKRKEEERKRKDTEDSGS